MSGQARVIVSYKVDRDCDGNIMLSYICKEIYPTATKEQLVATKDENIKLQTYNGTTIMQLGRSKVKVENNKRVKLCSFLVVAGNGLALLGTPGIETLDKLLTVTQEIQKKVMRLGVIKQKKPTARSQQWRNNM